MLAASGRIALCLVMATCQYRQSRVPRHSSPHTFTSAPCAHSCVCLCVCAGVSLVRIETRGRCHHFSSSRVEAESAQEQHGRRDLVKIQDPRCRGSSPAMMQWQGVMVRINLASSGAFHATDLLAPARGCITAPVVMSEDPRSRLSRHLLRLFVRMCDERDRESHTQPRVEACM